MKKTTPPADALLRSNPGTVVWGSIPSDKPPVLRIRSGQAVRIETVSHQPLTRQDPVSFFAAAGIAENDVLPEAIAIHRDVKRAEGMGAHILTGPIFVEDKEIPGVRPLRKSNIFRGLV